MFADKGSIQAGGINLLLTGIVKLPRGSWVIQNGANSGIGRATVAIAKSLGLKPSMSSAVTRVVDEIKALGGDERRSGSSRQQRK
jgi:NADPH:quinone reductase-like Zn-dependent oxidoreductase